MLRVEKVVPIQDIGTSLAQRLPAEVLDCCGIGVDAVENILGDAAFINVGGKRTINYEFQITIEVIHEGAGAVVLLANVTNEGDRTEVL